MIVCSIPLSRATSLSGRNCRCQVARRESWFVRGSQMTSFVPRSTAFLIHVAATGWFTVGLAPMRKMRSACATSSTGLLTAPEPMPSSSAATELAWQSRVQWSTWLLPITLRTSFWNR